MTDVTIYTTPTCPYCHMAKGLLRRKNVVFTEIDVSQDRAKRMTMTQLAGGRSTVPQIFIGTTHVGGCDDLQDLEHEGKLDPLLVA